MKIFTHDNVAKTYEVFQDRKYYYLVSQPYFGGDLTKLGKKAVDKGVKMREGWWRNLFRQCLDGLSYLHSRAIIHADIKEPNIMIAEDDSFKAPKVVLIDFGLAMSFSSVNTGIGGTPGYIPPETFFQGCWRPRGDIFSLGVVFFQMVSGQVPTADGRVKAVLGDENFSMDFNVLANIVATRPLPWNIFPSNMPLLQSLINMMTQRDPDNRPRAPQVLEHEWFDSQNDADLPEENLVRLVRSSGSDLEMQTLVHMLVENNNSNELRCLDQELRRCDPTNSGRIEKGQFEVILDRYGVSPSVAKSYIAESRQNDGLRAYAALMQETMRVKTLYDEQMLEEMFMELDKDGDGVLNTSEIHELLRSDAFDTAYEDIDELMSHMDIDNSGTLSIVEFKTAVLKDGRVSRRAECNQAASSCQWACT